MEKTKFNEKYESLRQVVENELHKYLDNLKNVDATLHDSMKYSVYAGGKRIRPVLMLAISEILGVNLKDVLPFAVSVELIHTYSLIHDDLPCMDNDDLRRGIPTNHKVYGESMALLSGDALLNLAYEICFRNVSNVYKINSARILSSYAGYQGMVGGQALDINSNSVQNVDNLLKMHEGKTVKLLMACTMIPCCLMADKYLEKMRDFGYNLGYVFQIVDDILDVTSTTKELGKTVNKDIKSGKFTFVTAYGLDGAMQECEKYYLKARSCLDGIDNNEFLLELLDYIKNRKN